MSAAVDLTVKKYDGTTDIVWTVVSASGGDKAPAVWRSKTAPGTVGQQPTIQFKARSNADGSVRLCDILGIYPSTYTNSATGQTEVRSTPVLTVSFAMPQNVVIADLREFVYQTINLLGTATFKASILDGYAPT
jgi:hypothetical protein